MCMNATIDGFPPGDVTWPFCTAICRSRALARIRWKLSFQPLCFPCSDVPNLGRRDQDPSRPCTSWPPSSRSAPSPSPPACSHRRPAALSRARTDPTRGSRPYDCCIASAVSTARSDWRCPSSASRPRPRWASWASGWLIASITLTAVAAGILIAFVLPRQDELLEQLGARRPVERAGTVQLAMFTGIFNLLWATVTVLMIIRPGLDHGRLTGSTRGADQEQGDVVVGFRAQRVEEHVALSAPGDGGNSATAVSARAAPRRCSRRGLDQPVGVQSEQRACGEVDFGGPEVHPADAERDSAGACRGVPRCRPGGSGRAADARHSTVSQVPRPRSTTPYAQVAIASPREPARSSRWCSSSAGGRSSRASARVAVLNWPMMAAAWTPLPITSPTTSPVRPGPSGSTSYQSPPTSLSAGR